MAATKKTTKHKKKTGPQPPHRVGQGHPDHRLEPRHPISKRISERADEKGYSLTHLARLIGIPRPTLTHQIRKSQPRAELIAIIAEVLEVSVYWVLTGEEEYEEEDE